MSEGAHVRSATVDTAGLVRELEVRVGRATTLELGLDDARQPVLDGVDPRIQRGEVEFVLHGHVDGESFALFVGRSFDQVLGDLSVEPARTEYFYVDAGHGNLLVWGTSETISIYHKRVFCQGKGISEISW